MDRFDSRILPLFLLIPLFGCGDGGKSIAPEERPGQLTVVIATSGEDADADGYNVRVAGRVESVAAADTLRLSLAPGRYSIALEGVAVNCEVPGGASQSTDILAGQTATIRYDVGCFAQRWEVGTIGGSSRSFSPKVVFTDTLRGIAASRGPEPEIFTTDDGGRSWSRRLQLSTTRDIGSLFTFIDANVGFLGGAARELFRTEDGGQTWEGQQIGMSGGYLLRASFPDAANGWVTGSNGGMFRTRDGGRTWEQNFNNPVFLNIFGVFFRDTLNGVIVSEKGLAFTTDDGAESWTQRATGTTHILQNLAFLDDSVGVAVGDAGTIIRTGDGGLTWSAREGAETTQLWSVDFGSDGFGVAAGEDGMLLVSRDRGLTWQRESAGTEKCCGHVFVSDSLHAWVAGPGGTVVRRIPRKTP